MAASSRRTEEKVASRSGSGRHCRRASRARALSLKLEVVLAYSEPVGEYEVITEGSIEQHASKASRSVVPPVAKPCC